jgi:hypothetical protein
MVIVAEERRGNKPSNNLQQQAIQSDTYSQMGRYIPTYPVLNRGWEPVGAGYSATPADLG